MNSSISNSRSVWRTLLVSWGPTLVIAGVLLGAAELWFQASPPKRVPRSLEDTILAIQLDRANRGGNADLLIIGDSSALMGIDATLLEKLLPNTNVESLATLGLVGPRGYARILQVYLRGYTGERPPKVVLLMHGVSLSLSESQLTFEEIALEGRWVNRARPGLRGRKKLYLDVILPLVSVPLPGHYGRHYGWPEQLVETIVRDQGTCFDPTPIQPARAPQSREAYEFSLNVAIATRLGDLGKMLNEHGIENVYVGITPIPESSHHPSTAESRNATLIAMKDSLSMPRVTTLDTPPAFPDSEFAGFSHLADLGRTRFTEMLATALSPME